MSKRFLKFMQNGQPLVIESDFVKVLWYDHERGCWKVTFVNGDKHKLNDENAKRLLKHIDKECVNLFDKPEEDI